MKKLELYEIDDISSYLKGFTAFTKYSPYLEIVALVPGEGGKLKLASGTLLTKKIGFNNGFSSTRRAIKAAGNGADIYYNVRVTPETASIRRNLDLNKVLINVDDNGYAEIVSKKYFIMYPNGELSASEKRDLRGVNFDTPVWVSEENGKIKISYDKPEVSTSFPKQGYQINLADINMIREAGLEDRLLNEDSFETYLQTGTNINKITLEEALSPEPINFQASGNEPKYYYEYDPMYEIPAFGDICELVLIGTTKDGLPVWKEYPKIIQNESKAHYADNAMNKGVRTMVSIPRDKIANLISESVKEGKEDGLKEFITSYENGEELLIETTLKNTYDNSHIKL